MNRKRSVLLVLLTLVGVSLAVVVPRLLAPSGPSRPPHQLPNLVLVVTDDQGYADVGFNGCEDIPTPHIDRIAREGVRFTQGYVSSSVCGPSRAGLMTGCYQDRFGFSLNPTIDPGNADAGLPLGETTLAEALKPRGYTSMAVGKWHLGTHPSLRPLERGFDEFFGFLSGGHEYLPGRFDLEGLADVRGPWEWYRTRLLRDRKRVATTGYLTDDLSDAAVDFIERRKDRPFFLYVAYNAPHTPLQAEPEHLARFGGIADPRRRRYAAMLAAVDEGVGRILAALDENGLDRHTLVVFLSDNGGPVGAMPSLNGACNDPLRGGKGTPFEGGIRVPFAARWTGTLPAGVDYDEPVLSLDIFATAAAHAGARPGTPPRRRRPASPPHRRGAGISPRASVLALAPSGDRGRPFRPVQARPRRPPRTCPPLRPPGRSRRVP